MTEWKLTWYHRCRQSIQWRLIRRLNWPRYCHHWTTPTTTAAAGISDARRTSWTNSVGWHTKTGTRRLPSRHSCQVWYWRHCRPARCTTGVRRCCRQVLRTSLQTAGSARGRHWTHAGLTTPSNYSEIWHNTDGRWLLKLQSGVVFQMLIFRENWYWVFKFIFQQKKLDLNLNKIISCRKLISIMISSEA